MEGDRLIGGGGTWGNNTERGDQLAQSNGQDLVGQKVCFTLLKCETFERREGK